MGNNGSQPKPARQGAFSRASPGCWATHGEVLAKEYYIESRELHMDELIFASATELAQAIRVGEISAVEVIEAYLARNDALDAQINAVVQRAPDALEQARQADADLAQGQIHGPLHGVPFTVKDVLGTAGLASAVDGRIRHRSAPAADATVVTRLRQAGAILLAKTNCPPNGSGSDTENTVSGRTLNPYRLDRTPGGSSGGEASLIAAGGSPIGLGADESGGIRVPAHYCGVAGLKPTAGRVPNTGAYNQPGGLTDPRTQIGPLARTVDDLALLLRVIAGPDNADSGTVPVPLGDPASVAVNTLTVAFFAEDPASSVTEETAHAVGAASQALARAGVEMADARPHDLVRDSREIDHFWRDMAGTRGQDVVELFAAWDYFRTRLLQFMARYDALLCPVDHHPAPPFAARDPERFDYTIPFSLTGYPAVVVRVGGSEDGMPIGVQVVAPPWREEIALALAAILEQKLGGWHPPSF